MSFLEQPLPPELQTLTQPQLKALEVGSVVAERLTVQGISGRHDTTAQAWCLVLPSHPAARSSV